MCLARLSENWLTRGLNSISKSEINLSENAIYSICIFWGINGRPPFSLYSNGCVAYAKLKKPKPKIVKINHMKKILNTILALTIVAFAIQGLQAKKGGEPAGGANPNGALFYDGGTVGTVVTPTSMPGRGVDDIYVISNGQFGQLGVASVAPGDKDYHGGRWAVHVATWVGAGDVPLFKSSQQVIDAYEAGDLEVMRVPAADFVCPVRKNG